ncbi:putative DNA-binding domain-containing protein [Roseateles sp.]|uniref:HvfC/BufC family peptide modification chaperone n=1 Tax=Roseateles sp. TaxID=1971397 RepID=UPI0031D5DD80
MTLVEFQRHFWRDLWAEQPSTFLAAQPGVAVYRNTVLKGCVDALLSLYPAVRRLTGDDWIAATALAYARAQPPSDGRLHGYGAGFPEFVANVLARGDDAQEWPWLSDVARLDRLWSESHIAADAPILSLADLAEHAGREGDALARLRLRPHPAARWHRSDHWPAFSLWDAARAARPDPNPPHWYGQSSLMTRPTGAVVAVEIDLGEHALLQACARGLVLGEALDEALSLHPETDASAALARLISRGAFTAITA